MDRTKQEIHMAMSEPKIGAEGEDFWSRHCHMNLLRGSVHGLTFSNMYLQFMESIKYFYIHCHLFKTSIIYIWASKKIVVNIVDYAVAYIIYTASSCIVITILLTRKSIILIRINNKLFSDSEPDLSWPKLA